MELLKEVVLILSSAALTGLLAHYLRIPHLIGFILAGVLIGPSGLGGLENSEDIHLWAEIGIILLLFTIGLELSPAHLSRLRRIVGLGGTFQIGATVVITALLAWQWGWSPGQALLWGFMISLSSTAVVLSLLQERHELETPYGQITLGILLFQDLMVVPMMLSIPLLAGKMEGPGGAWLTFFARTVGVLFGLYLVVTRLVPWIMDRVAATRSRELFLLTVITLCLGISGATYLAGLSLSMGAFLAGFVLSRSPYHAQIMAEILPFRDLLVCLFFVSVGMLFDPGVLKESLYEILFLSSGIMVLKMLVVFLAVLLLKYPFKTALLTGFLLFQIGEFSFVLAQEGLKYGLLSPETHQQLIALTLISILLTPLVHAVVTRKISLLPVGGTGAQERPRDWREHLVIIGYGVIGRHLARAARKACLPFVVIELNPVTVKVERKKGLPIIFGDATSLHILEEAGVKEARTVAVTVPDSRTARLIVSQVRRLNPRAYIIVRTRFAAEIEVLKALGADEVVAEELAASLEIFRQLMVRYGLSPSFLGKLLTEDLKACPLPQSGKNISDPPGGSPYRDDSPGGEN